MGKDNWVFIGNAYGDFELIGSYSTYKDSVIAAQIHYDTSERPKRVSKGYYEIRNGVIVDKSRYERQYCLENKTNNLSRF